MTRRVSMADVAVVAGVSAQTVSRVVNDSPRVDPATRANVEAAMSQLGYRMHRAARALRTGRTNTISLIVANLSSVGNAKLPLPWSSFQARNILANGTIGANKVSTFALDFLPDEGLYEIMGSVFFTSSSIVTVRNALNPSIYDAITSSPTAGVFLTTGESRCAGFYAALVKNKTIRFSNTGNNEATNGYINVIAYRKVGD